MRTSLRISNPKIYLARLSTFCIAFLTLFLISCSSSSEDPEYEIPRDDEQSMDILAPSEEVNNNEAGGNDN